MEGRHSAAVSMSLGQGQGGLRESRRLDGLCQQFLPETPRLTICWESFTSSSCPGRFRAGGPRLAPSYKDTGVQVLIVYGRKWGQRVPITVCHTRVKVHSSDGAVPNTKVGPGRFNLTEEGNCH